VLEFFKEEQAAFAADWALTMGQWLSLPPGGGRVAAVAGSADTRQPGLS
jgi:hypothetical protein